MSVRVIEIDDAECLRKVTDPVQFPLSAADKQVIEDLLDTLNDCDKATGLAAPQIGVNSSIIVYKIGNHVPPTVMINPHIVKARDYEDEGKLEMCLSFPERIYVVNRYKNITVRFQDQEGEVYVLKYRGFEARVLQHEIDHLSGITINDKGEMLDRETTELLLKGAAEHDEESYGD